MHGDSGDGTGSLERWAEAGRLAPGLVHELRHPLMGLKAGLRMLPPEPVCVTGTPGALLHALTNLLVNALDANEEAGGSRLPWAHTEFCIELSASALLPEESERPPSALPEVSFLPTPELASAPGAPAGPVAREDLARILVVEDEPVILLMLEKALGLEGHTVVTASRGEEAAERLRAEHFDLLVTDKNLPDRGGVELAALARARNPEMGLVLTTAYATRESAQELLRLRADAYLTRPFDTEVLVEHTRQLLARRRLLARLKEAHGGAPVVARVREALVVDPDLESRQLVVRHLQRSGLHVRVADDVLTGLEQTPSLDALVVPASLLGSVAREALRRLLVCRPGFRVVVISEPRSLGDNLTAIAVGSREQLVRPLSEAEVKRVLTHALAPAPGGLP